MLIRKGSVNSFLLLGLVYASFAPWFFWSYQGLVGLLFSLLLTFIALHRISNSQLLHFCIIYLCAIITLLIFGYDPLVSFALALGVSALYIQRPYDIFLLGELFKRTLGFLCAIGLVFWVFHNFIGDLSFAKLGSISPDLISNIKKDAGVVYILYPLSIRLETDALYLYYNGIYRFQSLFDEPGFLGTVCALFLAAEGRKRFDKYSLILLLGGLASLSLAFYVIYGFYLMTSMLKEQVKGLFFLFFIIILGVVVYISTDIIDIYILSRLEFNNGSFSGDNRATDNVSELFSQWISNGGVRELLIGIDYLRDGSSSWHLLFLNGGLLGVFFLLLMYFFFYKKFSNGNHLSWSFYSFLLVFIISVYQRVPYLHIIYLFLFCYAAVVDTIKEFSSTPENPLGGPSMSSRNRSA